MYIVQLCIVFEKWSIHDSKSAQTNSFVVCREEQMRLMF